MSVCSDGVNINTRMVIKKMGFIAILQYSRFPYGVNMSEQHAKEQLVLIVDSEGCPCQELAAICVDLVSGSIKDVYLKWAKPPSKDDDWYSRKHIHGLSLNFLENYGLENEEALVADFNSWRQKFIIDEMFAHAPDKENILLNCRITDVAIPPWAKRRTEWYHRHALCMKIFNLSIKGTCCSRMRIHSAYEGWKPSRNRGRTRDDNPGDMARQEYGHHCALYDCVSILLYKFPNTELAESVSLTKCYSYQK